MSQYDIRGDERNDMPKYEFNINASVENITEEMRIRYDAYFQTIKWFESRGVKFAWRKGLTSWEKRFFESGFISDIANEKYDKDRKEAATKKYAKEGKELPEDWDKFRDFEDIWRGVGFTARIRYENSRFRLKMPKWNDPPPNYD